MTALQQPLWHDSAEDAFRSLVDAIGGFKRVGCELWPALPADQAGRRLAQCLDADRPEKLTLAETAMLLRRGRMAGVHTAATFLMRDAGYADPVPVDPETEKQRLQREFIAAQQNMARMLNRIGELDGRP